MRFYTSYQFPKRTSLLAVTLINCAVFSPIANAQTVAQCDGSLNPSVESRKTDYALLQAFAKVNVDELYDTMQKGASSSAGGGVSYGGFGVDFQQSNSRSDFKERVEKRLVNEQFNLSESDARAYYRQRLSDAQLAAWQACIRSISGAGAVLLSARNLDEGGFSLVATWVPQTGVGQGTLELKARDGTINGKKVLTDERVGRGSKSYEVLADSKDVPVKISANIVGVTDNLMATQTPTKPPVICLNQAEVKRHSLDDNFLRAPLNQAACFKHRSYTGAAPDIDAWYRINVVTEGILKVQLSGISTTEFELQVRDLKGEVVARPIPHRSSGAQSIEYPVTNPGNYFIRPQPYSGPSEYFIEVSFDPTQ